jgi:hypothetical protein
MRAVHSLDSRIKCESIMRIAMPQRCLRAANYRYSRRSSLLLIVLSALTYGAVVYEAAKVLDEQEVTHAAK